MRKLFLLVAFTLTLATGLLAQGPTYTDAFIATINFNTQMPCGSPPPVPTSQIKQILSNLVQYGGGTLDLTCYQKPVTLTADVFSPVTVPIRVWLPETSITINADATIGSNFQVCYGPGSTLAAGGGFTLTNNAMACFGGGGGSGTVLSFSAGNLSPLFTTSVATSTTTPALTFNLSSAAGFSWFGNASSTSGLPAFNTSELPYSLIPPASPAAPGGIESITCDPGNSITEITTAGVPNCNPVTVVTPWSSLIDPVHPSNLVLSMTDLGSGGGGTIFNYQSSNSPIQEWTWANTFPATSSSNSGSPRVAWCGQYWTGSASAYDCWQLGVPLTFSGQGSYFEFGHSGNNNQLPTVLVPGLQSSSGIQAPTITTVSDLSTLASLLEPATLLETWVGDGAGPTDCSVGGGTTLVKCFYNGTTWTAEILTGGGGSPGSPPGTIQGNDSGAFAAVPGSVVDFINGLIALTPTGTGVALSITGDGSGNFGLGVQNSSGGNAIDAESDATNAAVENPKGGNLIALEVDSTGAAVTAIGVTAGGFLAGTNITEDIAYGVDADASSVTGTGTPTEVSAIWAESVTSAPGNPPLIIAGLHVDDQNLGMNPATIVNAAILINDQGTGANVFGITSQRGPNNLGDILSPGIMTLVTGTAEISTYGEGYQFNCSDCDTPPTQGATCTASGDHAGALAVAVEGGIACFGLNIPGGTNPLTAIGQVYVGGTGGTPAAAGAGLTGQIFRSTNAAQPTFVSPGIAGTDVSSTPYVVQCDSATATIDRASTLRLTSGAAAVTIPDPSTSGCGSFFPVVLINDGAGTVTATSAVTGNLNIVNGASNSDAQTAFTLKSGQYAALNSPDNVNWNVRIVATSPAPTVTSFPAEASALTNSVVFTAGGADTSAQIGVALSCHAVTSGGTIAPTLGYTDWSGTAQTVTVGSAADCTTLGSASVAQITVQANVQASSTVTISTILANAPTYDLTVGVLSPF